MFISFSFYFLLCYSLLLSLLFFFFFNDTATTEIYTLSLHDALPISGSGPPPSARRWSPRGSRTTSCDSAARRPRPLPPRMPDATGDSVSVRCCIVGGGPAGIMLGLLLARAGVSVLVLEKHADFLRDFRGDTIHPSTLDVMHELGLLDDVLRLPHQEIRELRAQLGEVALPIADFTHLPTRCRFLALMPQWDFLNLLVERATTRYPAFHRRMRAQATELLHEGRRVGGGPPA